jgi:hypothetical protein
LLDEATGCATVFPTERSGEDGLEIDSHALSS